MTYTVGHVFCLEWRQLSPSLGLKMCPSHWQGWDGVDQGGERAQAQFHWLGGHWPIFFYRQRYIWCFELNLRPLLQHTGPWGVLCPLSAAEATGPPSSQPQSSRLGQPLHQGAVCGSHFTIFPQRTAGLSSCHVPPSWGSSWKSSDWWSSYTPRLSTLILQDSHGRQKSSRRTRINVSNSAGIIPKWFPSQSLVELREITSKEG